IKKSTNCNKNKTLILQAHSDMVCEKNANKTIDFLSEGIKTFVKDDFMFADGTTLGADNGIGLSMILSILDDNAIKIPNLECVFTAQEESTMNGAFNLNTNLLNGRHLLSIDGTDEGKIEVSSAGMTVFEAAKKYTNYQTLDYFKLYKNCGIYKIELTDFRGGHSGSEIHTNKQNVIKHAGSFLSKIKDKIQFINICAGNKSNAIPRDFSCIVLAHNLSLSYIKNIANDYLKTIIAIEPFAKFKITKLDFDNIQKRHATLLSLPESTKIINFICNYQNGVLNKNQQNFVVSSNNLASINLNNCSLSIVVSLRSSNKIQNKQYEDTILNYFKSFDLQATITSRAPFFERNTNSYLQPLCQKTYKALFNKDAVLEDIHAGLEGGVFSEKIKDIDICVIAPNIYDAHSPSERVSLSSIERVYKWLENIVENF
ncbi:MAG: M20/M25/M40 family metallo-hydrolase, partial [Clostridia bacterium]|nr:M20/M25/M40 family metallo-hydrolase [Clostridia bacterium]